MEITVIRHGQTIENLQGICQGQSEGTLSERGREQALALSCAICDDTFDLVVTSDLRRAVDTADIIFKGRVSIKLDSRLRERGLYSLQGGELYPDIDYCGHIDGCESMDELFARVKELLYELKEHYSDRRVALISHGITIRIIRSICEDIDVEKTVVVENCSLNRFIIP